MIEPIYEYVKGIGWQPTNEPSRYVIQYKSAQHNWINIWADERTYSDKLTAQTELQAMVMPKSFKYRIVPA